VEAELLHADRQTDRHAETDIMKLIIAFHNSVNKSKKTEDKKASAPKEHCKTE
jgi:hypothetical protein